MSFDVGDIVVCNLDSRVHAIVDIETDEEGYAVFFLSGFGRGFHVGYLKEATPYQMRQWAEGMQDRIATVVSDLHDYGQTHHKCMSPFPTDREDRRDWVAIAHRKEAALTKELRALEDEMQQ